MSEIIFTEDQLGNLNEIGQQLFSDTQDPRSNAYIRILKRPKISLVKTILLFIVLPVITIIALCFLLYYAGLTKINAIIIGVVILLAYIGLSIKKFSISAIKLYQKYAPDAVRNKCRYEPSCSEYMLLSIEKHGFIKGVKKGILRLKRCNVDNGGFDFP